MAEYRIFEVPDDAAETMEQMGTKAKFWYEDEEFGTTLFKEGRASTGENWSEKLTAELATLLDLPHARYELATYKNRQGVISPLMVGEDDRLVHGNEILSKYVDDYDVDAGYGQSQHTVRHVSAVMRSSTHLPPEGWRFPAPLNTTYAAFVGYIFFDAWIGNTDRHHENWAFNNQANREIRLAPTFDHASSLGRELTDEGRQQILDGGMDALRRYGHRGRSALFKSHTDKRALLLVSAVEEFVQGRDGIRDAWLAKYAALDFTEIEAIIKNVPESFMSATAVKFAIRLLCVNRESLLGLA